MAASILQRDDLVAIPTETVYGLAGNIFSKKAIKKIFELKQRPLFNPLIVHIKSVNELQQVVRYIPEKAKLLATAFWPGALTLVLPKRANIPDLITAGKDTVAVRVPNHTMTLELLNKIDFPLAAPSANPFGCISPTNALHVQNYFDDELPMILDGGNCEKGIESSIVGFENDEPIVYRLGSTSVEAIEKIIGTIKIKNKNETAPDAPGMLSRHYAPFTTTYLTDSPLSFVSSFQDKKMGLLLFNKTINAPFIQHQLVLSTTANIEEAATNLYAHLHTLDKLELDMIVVERLPDNGLGKSINDRLERATKKK